MKAEEMIKAIRAAYDNSVNYDNQYSLEDIRISIDKLAGKSHKDVEIKILFEAREVESNEFIGYGEPVWVTIKK